MARRALYVAVAVLTALVLTGCLPGANPNVGAGTADASPAGFLLGLWHGIILWVSFIVSLFNSDVSIYEVNNTGWPYSLGFIMGAAPNFSAAVAGSRRKKRESAD